jgi:hypothetical protein
MTELKQKLILLFIGSCFTGGTVLATFYFDRFTLRADYDKDKVSNAIIMTELSAGLRGIKKSNEEIKQELKEIKMELRSR